MINGLYKVERIHWRGQWKTREGEELATLEWVAWFNYVRLPEPIGHIPPTEAEANDHRELTSPVVATTGLEPNSFHESRGGSLAHRRDMSVPERIALGRERVAGIPMRYMIADRHMMVMRLCGAPLRRECKP